MGYLIWRVQAGRIYPDLSIPSHQPFLRVSCKTNHLGMHRFCFCFCFFFFFFFFFSLGCIFFFCLSWLFGGRAVFIFYYVIVFGKALCYRDFRLCKLDWLGGVYDFVSDAIMIHWSFGGGVFFLLVSGIWYAFGV
jgi:hypothetical protein